MAELTERRKAHGLPGDFLDFLVFLETSEVAGPGPNPREIDISFGADGPLACARPDPTIGWNDVLPCVFVCVWGR